MLRFVSLLILILFSNVLYAWEDVCSNTSSRFQYSSAMNQCRQTGKTWSGSVIISCSNLQQSCGLYYASDTGEFVSSIPDGYELSSNGFLLTNTNIQDCPINQYKDNGICQPIPNCNSNTANGGNFFDVTTRNCVTPEVEILICIGSNSKFCPPINDCQKPTDICTNNQANLDAHAVANMNVPNVKDSADQIATTAQQTATAANLLHDAHVTTYNQALSNYESALAAYELDPTAQNAASLQVSIVDLQQASQLSSTSMSGSSSASTAASNSSSAAGSINPQQTKIGRAENYEQEANFWKEEALRAYDALLRNRPYYIGSYTGTNSGGSGGGEDTEPTGPEPGTTGDSYESNYNLPSADAALSSAERFGNALNDQPVISAVNQIRALNFSPVTTCPALELDTTTEWFGVLTMTTHCDLVAGHETLIGNFANLVWILTALLIFIGA